MAPGVVDGVNGFDGAVGVMPRKESVSDGERDSTIGVSDEMNPLFASSSRRRGSICDYS